jgi:phenylalanyl-tRNA synthetase alpha chain
MSDTPNPLSELETAATAARERVAAAASLDALEAAKVELLGRKGTLTALLSKIATVPPEQKREFGKRANEIKREIEAALDARRDALNAAALTGASDFEPTTPGRQRDHGHQHPVLAMRRELEDVFTTMGFRVVEGPELETEYFNFEALNIPDHHPARDSQDTFFAEAPAGEKWVLRTHTSPAQVRSLLRFGAPLRVVAPGRVYRNEACDATHESAFHQIEGLLVDRDISVAHLKGVMAEVLTRVLRRDVKVRLRPHFFPFVEPGFELDMACAMCGGAVGGCSLCKRTGWIEMLGCGMVHVHVLRAGGVDPDVFTGFAFGMGIDRLTMARYQIEDIRHFHGGDLRFFEQF